MIATKPPPKKFRILALINLTEDNHTRKAGLGVIWNRRVEDENPCAERKLNLQRLGLEYHRKIGDIRMLPFPSAFVGIS